MLSGAVSGRPGRGPDTAGSGDSDFQGRGTWSKPSPPPCSSARTTPRGAPAPGSPRPHGDDPPFQPESGSAGTGTRRRGGTTGWGGGRRVTPGRTGGPPHGARHRASRLPLDRGGGDVAGRSRRSTGTTPRGRPRAGPHRAGPARARRASSTPHRSAAARSACTWHTSPRVSSSPGRRGDGQHPHAARRGCAPAGNRGRGRCESDAVLTERGRCLGFFSVFEAMVFSRSRGSVERGSAGRGSRRVTRRRRRFGRAGGCGRKPRPAAAKHDAPKWTILDQRSPTSLGHRRCEVRDRLRHVRRGLGIRA